MKEMKVKLTLTEEMLGSQSNNPEVHKEFIASKAKDAKKIEEEVEAIGVDAVEEKEMTVFPRNDKGEPCVWDYQVKGFFKAAGKAGGYIGGDSKLTAYKSKIDTLVFIKERKIDIIPPKGKKVEIGNCQRPLRGQTAQGERIALANSETVPAGCTLTFTIQCLDDKMMAWVKKWLDYGQFSGLGQWRNSGKGRFAWEEVK